MVRSTKTNHHNKQIIIRCHHPITYPTMSPNSSNSRCLLKYMVSPPLNHFYSCSVKWNVTPRRTSLGGRQHGYLALILGPEVYKSIATTTEFNRPEDPGHFVIRSPPISRATRKNPDPVAPLLTSADIHIQKANYDTSLRQFNKCQAIELALKNQITDAIEHDYLSALHDLITDMIPTNIPAIFEFLQANYGKISPNLLMEK